MKDWIRQAEANKAAGQGDHIVISNGNLTQIWPISYLKRLPATARVVYRTDEAQQGTTWGEAMEWMKTKFEAVE